ncbi:MAG: HAD-IA family hydrolase [Phormidesmis sp.]
MRVVSQKNQSLQTFSFDVFDTCVTRHYARPVDMFEPLFAQLLSEAGCLNYQRSVAANALARQRMMAERLAHRQTAREEITLADIYQVLAPQLATFGLDAPRAMQAEVDIELAALSPILCTRLRIDRLRKQGHQIVFISDMYLSGETVRQMLSEQGFLEPEDRVYVSSDVGVTKGSGKLFRYVCDQLQLAPRELHHTGDNFFADVRAANREGLRWSYFTQGAPNRYEQTGRVELLGEAWARSHLIGLARAVRLKHDYGTAESRRQTMLSANLVAPLLTGYVGWVLVAAGQAGVERLGFVGALGEKLLAIAQTLAPNSAFLAASPLQLSLSQPSFSQLNSSQLDDSSPCDSINGIGVIIGQCGDQPPTGDADQSSTPKALRFNLLDPTADQIAPASSAAGFGSGSSYLDYVYLEMPLAMQTSAGRFLDETAYLSKYSDVLEGLLRPLGDDLVDDTDDFAANYWTIVLDYAAGLAQLPRWRDQLDMLKRYAVGNVVDFLTQPTADDALALMTVQQQAGLDKSVLMARPIGWLEVFTFAKRTLKQTRPRKDFSGSWLEASAALSVWPLRWLLSALLWSVRGLSRYVVMQRPMWFNRLLLLGKR